MPDSWIDYLRSRYARLSGYSTGGYITGGAATTPDRVPGVLSRGAVGMSRAHYDALGEDSLARITSVYAWPGTRPDLTVVEPDGSLTEIEGSGP